MTLETLLRILRVLEAGLNFDAFLGDPRLRHDAHSVVTRPSNGAVSKLLTSILTVIYKL